MQQRNCIFKIETSKFSSKYCFRFLTVVMLVLLLVSFLSFSALAARYTEGYFYYDLVDGGIVITGYFGKENTVRLPNQIAGYPVSSIAAGAFLDTTVRQLYLPDTIMEINENAIARDITVFFSDGKTYAPTAEPIPSETASPVSPDAVPQRIEADNGNESVIEPLETTAPVGQGADVQVPDTDSGDPDDDDSDAAPSQAPKPVAVDSTSEALPSDVSVAVPKPEHDDVVSDSSPPSALESADPDSDAAFPAASSPDKETSQQSSRLQRPLSVIVAVAAAAIALIFCGVIIYNRYKKEKHTHEDL